MREMNGIDFEKALKAAVPGLPPITVHSCASSLLVFVLRSTGMDRHYIKFRGTPKCDDSGWLNAAAQAALAEAVPKLQEIAILKAVREVSA